MPVFMLEIQYRMPLQIAAWPGYVFYEEKLQNFKPEPTKKDLPPGFSWWNDAPLAFINICTRQTLMRCSYANAGEITVISQTIEKMISAGMFPSQIGVISRYAAQTQLLNRKLP